MFESVHDCMRSECAHGFDRQKAFVRLGDGTAFGAGTDEFTFAGFAASDADVQITQFGRVHIALLCDCMRSSTKQIA